MSGIVGIVLRGGARVDEGLLRRMTASMCARGPDGQAIWLDRSAGLGHTALRTASKPDNGALASLDGEVWITADARVDGRADLVRKLESHATVGLASASDSQLILHAYHAWGEACVAHLLGDFAFAIWNGRSRRLFCARDHFGVKPFFYARIPGGIVFSNTLDCVRLHPAADGALNELAIADFLLFGWNQDPAATTFASVRRLPGAHTLSWESDDLRITRYWSLPTGGRLRYRRSQEYVDHFREVMTDAVRDRLPVNHVGVWMSGGMDSTAIASTAQQLLEKRGAPFEVRGHTIVYDTLIRDEERHFASLAAKATGVQHSCLVADGYGPLDGWDRPDLFTPEPTDDPYYLTHILYLKQAASHSPVLLCGEGGDEVFWPSTVVDLLGRVALPELATSVARSVLLHRRRPAAGVRARLHRWRRREPPPPFPSWLNGALAERLGLRDRWRQFNAPPALEDHHPVRAEAHRRLATGPWPWYFEFSDPGVTRVPVESRYPFFDVRLVSYLLSLPPFPWSIDKHLLRLAMRGRLPEAIRLRPKAPLAGDPLREHLRAAGAQWLDRFEPVAQLARVVDRAALPPLAGGGGDDPWLNIRPLCLNYWLSRDHNRRCPEELPHDHQATELRRRSPAQEDVREPATGGLRRHS